MSDMEIQVHVYSMAQSKIKCYKKTHADYTIEIRFTTTSELRFHCTHLNYLFILHLSSVLSKYQNVLFFMSYNFAKQFFAIRGRIK